MGMMMRQVFVLALVAVCLCCVEAYSADEKDQQQSVRVRRAGLMDMMLLQIYAICDKDHNGIVNYKEELCARQMRARVFGR